MGVGGNEEGMGGSAPWLYVDDKRTHELRVSVEPGRPATLVVRECAFGGSPIADQLTMRVPYAEPSEREELEKRLERKLALLGTYFRAGTRGWVRLASAPTEAAELAPLSLSGSSEGALEFHHYNGDDRRATTLVAVHRETPRGRRTLLVRLDYTFPDTDGGELHVIHNALIPPLYRSALAGLHLELRERGLRKVTSDARHAADPRTWAALQAALDAILGRLVQAADARDEAAILRDPSGRPLDARAVVVAVQAMKRANGAASHARDYDVTDEIDPRAGPAQARPPDVLIDEIPADVATALHEPKLLALHARFLAPGQEADLLARGERAILAATREVRQKARPDEQHLVSLLEASLMLRHAFAKRVPVDPEIIHRVQHARAYL